MLLLKLALTRPHKRGGVQPVRGTRAHKSLGALKYQSSKLKWAAMHELFVVALKLKDKNIIPYITSLARVPTIY